MDENGIQIVALIRLAPLPFATITYVLGVTRVKTKDFFIGSLSYVIRSTPRIYLGCLMYEVSMGSESQPSDQSFSEAQSDPNQPHLWNITVEDFITILNVIFSILAGGTIGYLAKKKI